MKRLLFLLLLLPAMLCAQQMTITKVQVKLSNEKFIPAIWYTPSNAAVDATTWLFICGSGEQLKGGATQTNLDNTYNRLLSSGNHADLVKNSLKYGMKILAPVIADEYNDWKPDIQGGKYIRDVTQWAINNLSIDPTRIIPIGLSSGGNAVFDAVVRDSNTAKLYAGAVPICSGELNATQGPLNWDFPAKYNIAVWAFHSKDDGPTTPPVMSVNQIARINSYNPDPAAKLTLYATGGHTGAWRNAFADTSLYKWALTLKRSSTPKPPDPEPPTKTIVAKLEITLYSDGSTETKKL